MLNDEATRALIYRAALALVALASTYDLVAPDEADAWAEVVTAVAGLAAAGLATLHTSRRRDDLP